MKQYLRVVLAALLAASLLLLAGCGAKSAAEPAPAEPPAAEAPAAEPEPAEPPAAEDGALRVGSVRELIEAIAPQTAIVVEPGRYDLTEFLADFPSEQDCDRWNEAHEYAKIYSTFDGQELVVENVEGLSITGGADDPAATEIVTQPRYATVLGFTNCRDVELACLTLGHTEGGACSGNVVDLYSCRDIRLRTMDLYGCGAYGISVLGGTGDVQVSSSTIRDCTVGPFDIWEAVGEIRFTACTLTGSASGGDYTPADRSLLTFVGCAFGPAESSRWYYDETAVFEDCEWSELAYYEYPDVEWTPPDFDPDHLTPLAIDKALLNDSYWIGQTVVDPQSGETRALGVPAADGDDAEYMWLSLRADGTGFLTTNEGELSLTWEESDPEAAALITPEGNFYVSLYADDRDPNALWLMMQYYNDVVWFC